MDPMPSKVPSCPGSAPATRPASANPRGRAARTADGGVGGGGLGGGGLGAAPIVRWRGCVYSLKEMQLSAGERPTDALSQQEQLAKGMQAVLATAERNQLYNQRAVPLQHVASDEALPPRSANLPSSARPRGSRPASAQVRRT